MEDPCVLAKAIGIHSRILKIFCLTTAHANNMKGHARSRHAFVKIISKSCFWISFPSHSPCLLIYIIQNVFLLLSGTLRYKFPVPTPYPTEYQDLLLQVGDFPLLLVLCRVVPVRGRRVVSSRIQDLGPPGAQFHWKTLGGTMTYKRCHPMIRLDDCIARAGNTGTKTNNLVKDTWSQNNEDSLPSNVPPFLMSLHHHSVLPSTVLILPDFFIHRDVRYWLVPSMIRTVFVLIRLHHLRACLNTCRMCFEHAWATPKFRIPSAIEH